MNQKQINEFKRLYLHSGYKMDWNKINLSAADSKEHNLMVATICVNLLSEGIPFLTQARFKSGLRPDVLAFGLPKKIIEVRASETDKQSQAKMVRIPEELQNEIVYISAFEPFEMRKLQ